MLNIFHFDSIPLNTTSFTKVGFNLNKVLSILLILFWPIINSIVCHNSAFCFKTTKKKQLNTTLKLKKNCEIDSSLHNRYVHRESRQTLDHCLNGNVELNYCDIMVMFNVTDLVLSLECWTIFFESLDIEMRTCLRI